MPFTPVPYAAPTIYNPQSGGDRVIDLMLRQGQIAGQGAAAQGQIWGPTIANLGQQAAQYVQQQQAQKQQEEAAQKAAQEQARREAIYNDALSSWDSNDPEGSIKKMAKQIGAPDAIKFGTGLMAMQSTLQKNLKGEIPTLAEVKDQVVALHTLKQGAPNLYAQIAPGAVQHLAPGLQAHLGVDVTKASPEDLDKGLETLGQQWGGENKAGHEYEVTVAGPNGPVKKLVQADELRKGVEEYVKPKDEAEDVPLAEAAIEIAARRYLKDGTLPPMGMGKNGVANRARILNRASAIDPNADIAGSAASYVADKGSLTQMQKQRDAIGAFENTAQKNIDLFLEQAGKVVDTGSPLANKAARYISGEVLGSPDVKAFNAARQVAINEIAKITTNPNLSGQLSDNARKEVEAFNPENATLAQAVSVMRVLKKDMENRKASLDAGLVEIKKRISPGSAAPAPTIGGIDPEVQKRLDRLKGLGGGS